MKLITIGDSITRGTYTGVDDPCPLSVANPNFSELLRQKLGFTELKCYGINGVCISRTSYQNPEYSISRNFDNTEDGDFLIIAGGTNDFGTNVELGTKDDREDVSFYGALYVLYSKVISRMPKEKVVVIIPIKREHEDKPNSVGYLLEDYRRAIIERATEFGFNLVDGKKMAIDPSDKESKKKYISDGLHPTQEGHYIYADYVYDCIKDLI